MNPRESDRRESPSGKTETTEAVASVQDNDLAKVKARLTTGRNDPCPCGSGRKYKRCCLTADETFVREAAKKHEIEAKERTEQGQQQRRDIQRATTDEIRPPLEQSPKALEPLSNEPTEADKLWEDLEALTSPTSEQLDLFLEKFLVLPPGETDWSDLLHLFSSYHTDLPSVFRRIAAVVPHTKEEGISYFLDSTRSAESIAQSLRRGIEDDIAEGAKSRNGPASSQRKGPAFGDRGAHGNHLMSRVTFRWKNLYLD
jgi:SEC-C motif